MNLPSIIVLSLVLLAALLVIIRQIRVKRYQRQHPYQGGCGCACNCSGCSGCTIPKSNSLLFGRNKKNNNIPISKSKPNNIRHTTIQ